jgi:hypothetical protein
MKGKQKNFEDREYLCKYLKIINTIPVILTQLVATSHYICRSRRTLHSLKVAPNYLTKENYQYIKDLKITNILY